MKHIYIYTHTHIQGRKIHTILNSIFLLKTEKNPNKIQATKKKNSTRTKFSAVKN